MKPIYAIFSLIGLFLLGCSASDSDSNDDAGPLGKRYGIKEGTVVYEISGPQSGSETLSWKRYGDLEAKHTDVKLTMMGMTQETNTRTIMDGEWIYNIDVDRNTARKMRNPVLERYQDVDLEKFGESMLERMGGRKAGSDTVAGETCEVWVNEGMGTEVCIWNGVPLRNVVSMGPMQIVQVATEISDEALPDKEFKLPEGLVIEEYQDPAQMMRKAMEGAQQR